MGDDTDGSLAGTGAGRVEAVARAARILKSFDIDHQVQSVRGIAERTGIARSVCHAIATTLVAEGLLEMRPGGGYQLGLALAPIGGLVLERTGLVERAIPGMEALSWKLGGEVHLAYGSGDSVVYLARVRRDRRVRMPNRYGEPMPLFKTGAGWAILAIAAEATKNRVMSALPKTTLERILQELAQFEERGFIVHENFELGICSVAAPIRTTGGVAAAISVAQPRPLMDTQRVAETGRLVRQVCKTIEEQYRIAEV